MKRIVALLVIFVIVLNLLPIASAAGEPQFKVTVSEEKTEAGTTLEVAVAAKTDAALLSLGFYLGYPADKVTLVETAAELDENSIAFGEGRKAGYPSLGIKNGQINYGVNSQDVFSAKAGHEFFVAHFSVKSGASGNVTFALKDLNFAYDGGSKTYGAGDTFPSATYTIAGAAATTVEPTPEPEPKPEEVEPPIEQPTTSFTDVKETDWFAPWVDKAVKTGLFQGNADGSFQPNAPITRAQFVTVLWRMAGKPAPKSAAPFADIRNESTEFQTAIAWAQETGAVQGVSQTAFSPRSALTREAAMTILFRFGGKAGMETMMTPIYDDTFADSGTISDWAKPALYWGVYNEILSGTSASSLSPLGTATRAQIAKILVGYNEKNAA